MKYDDMLEMRDELTTEEAEAILAENPDATLVTDWLAGGLSEEESKAVRMRLRTEQEFRDLAMPLIEAWESVPPLRDTLTPSEHEASWRHFQAMAGILPEPAPVAPMVSARAFRRLVLAVAVLLLITLPGAAWLGYRLVTIGHAPQVRVAEAREYSETVALDRVSTVMLQRGSRLFWSDGPDGSGVRDMTLIGGAALFSLDSIPGVTWVIVTPSGRLRMPNAIVQVDVRDPQYTFVRVDRGRVTLEAHGTPTVTQPLAMVPGDRAVLVHGLSPRLANP